MSRAARSSLALRSSVTSTLCVGLAALVLVNPSSAQAPQRDGIHRVRRPVQGRYIVAVRRTADADAVAVTFQRLARGRVRHVYRNAYKGFAIDASEPTARALASDPAVAYVEEDGVVRTAEQQALNQDDSWGLDRIDQRVIAPNGAPAYDHTYRYSADGNGVHVYIVDTGIRTSHAEFGGRASAAFNAIPDGHGQDDCYGHGTHVAGTVAGVRYGVAKSAMLHSVRVLGCEGTGYVSDLIAGIDWITAHRVRPAVINMSIQAGASDAFNESARGAMAAGIVFVAAAGNEGIDSCGGLVGGESRILVAGASDASDGRVSFSNYGRCVDLFAPGVDITSAYRDSDDDWRVLSGTSMASPHVAGAVALYVQHRPEASPTQVALAITSSATKGVIRGPGIGSPNRLLFTPHFGDTTPPTISVVRPARGASVRGIQTVQISADDDIEMSTVSASACGSPIGSDPVAPYSIDWNTATSPDGPCSVEVEGRDLAGNVASARVSVTVQNKRDVTPPQLTLSARAGRIWSRNGKLVPVTFTGTVSDTDSSITTVSFKTGDEYGRVQPKGTAAVTNGRFEITVYLEASRRGADGDGRRYVMRVSASDGAGNGTSATASAIVPHDSGN